MRRVVTEQSLAFVATVCPDGTPNLSPKGTIAVWDDDHLVFAHIHSPHTVANLATNPAIEVNVVDPIVRKGYRFKGTAQVVAGGELYDRLTDFFTHDRNLNPDRVKAIVLVTVEHAEPLISPAYDAGASETGGRGALARAPPGPVRRSLSFRPGRRTSARLLPLMPSSAPARRRPAPHRLARVPGEPALRRPGRVHPLPRP